MEATFSKPIIGFSLKSNTFSLLIDGIQTDIGMTEANSKLSVWDATLLGDFNPHGLRQFPPIKLRKRGPDRMLFHMKY